MNDLMDELLNDIDKYTNSEDENFSLYKRCQEKYIEELVSDIEDIKKLLNTNIDIILPDLSITKNVCINLRSFIFRMRIYKTFYNIMSMMGDLERYEYIVIEKLMGRYIPSLSKSMYDRLDKYEKETSIYSVLHELTSDKLMVEYEFYNFEDTIESFVNVFDKRFYGLERFGIPVKQIKKSIFLELDGMVNNINLLTVVELVESKLVNHVNEKLLNYRYNGDYGKMFDLIGMINVYVTYSGLKELNMNCMINRKMLYPLDM